MRTHNKLNFILTAFLILVGASVIVYAADNRIFVNVNHMGNSIYNLTNVNASKFYGDGSGLTGVSGSGNASTGHCPAGSVVMNVTGAGVQCVASGAATDRTYTNEVVNGNFSSSTNAAINNYSLLNSGITQNNTDAKAFSMAQYNGNNTRWSDTSNASYMLQIDMPKNETKIFQNITSNLTIRGVLNVTNITLGANAYIYFNGSAICIGAC